MTSKAPTATCKLINALIIRSVPGLGSSGVAARNADLQLRRSPLVALLNDRRLSVLASLG